MSDSFITLVTGASSGIGQALAIGLATDNTTIVAVGHSNESGLNTTISTIREQGYSAFGFLCDLKNPIAVKNLFLRISEIGLPIHHVINNAGISLVKLITDTSYEEWQNIINTNLTSAFNICHEVLPQMIRHHHGHILNISSIWGNEGASMEVAYSASKGGLNSFTKALAKEVGPSGIRVNAIALGVVNTSMNAWLTPDEKDTLTDSISLGRFASTDDVTQFVKSLLYQSPYLNGQIITYDGGMY